MGVAADTADAAREQFMLTAIAQARRCMAAGGAPVGACLVRDGSVIVETASSTISELDITAHAEVQALRAACRELRTLDLAGCELYVTVEPCLMCFTASAYARIDRIFYGAPIGAFAAVTGHEFGCDHERLPANSPQLSGGLLEPECRALIDEWAAQSGRVS